MGLEGRKILWTRELSLSFGALRAVDRVSIEVPENRITLIIGPNGSGKSTLLKTLMGLSTLYSGRIYLGEEDITRHPPYNLIRGPGWALYICHRWIMCSQTSQ